MGKDPETYHHKQQLLDKLKTGKLTSQEREELDQLCLEDPFLRDAVEGYDLFPEADHQTSINKLKSKVTSDQNEKSHSIIPLWMKAASVVLIVACAGWLLRGNLFHINQEQFADQSENEIQIEPPLFNQSDEDDSYAIVETEELSHPDQLLPVDQQNSGSNGQNREEKMTTSRDNQPALLKELFHEDTSLRMASVPPEPDIAAAGEVAISESAKDIEALQAESQPENKAETSDEVVTEASEMSKQQNERDTQTHSAAFADNQPLKSYSNAMSQIDLHRTIIGTVTDGEGSPLIGANVLEKGTKNGAITDQDGRFSITLLDTQNSVVINFLGFDEQEIPPTLLGQNIEVQLLENPEILDEVIVGAYSKKSRQQERKEMDSDRTIPAEPTIGSRKFKRYIKENALYPSGHSKETINGTVKVRFQLNANGSPVAVEVVSSFNHIFNAEAIRLITQGGTWKPKRTGQSGWIEYEVQF